MKIGQQGFSLIELMIVVAIIALLASIAIPGYDAYMKESRRSDAHVALMRMADQQERYYLQNNDYATAESDVGGTGTERNWYSIEITSANGSAFALTATPVAGGPQADDADCPTLTLDSAGSKGPPGCW